MSKAVSMEDLEMVDEQINNMMDRIELEGETCHLKHSKEDPSENHPATDYLCQNLGPEFWRTYTPIENTNL
jgi:hypothetical protein